MAAGRAFAVKPGAHRILSVHADAVVFPTEGPEADGTLAWDSTTMVLCRVRTGEEEGVGYTYTDASGASLIQRVLGPTVEGMDAMSPRAAWSAMRRAVRNMGRPGIASAAISAVDSAVWDLKARLLGVPLATLLGQVRSRLEVYGSGGFTNLDGDNLVASLQRWVDAGCRRVKMKIGASDLPSLRRVELVRERLGPDVELFIDANGALTVSEAVHIGPRLAELGVTWFEEPVPMEDLRGLREVRRRMPAGVRIASGEYAWEPGDVQRLLDAGAVDVLEVDASRCGGVTGFLLSAELSAARGVPMTSHCCPALHVPICCASAETALIEVFHDHDRIERAVFDGYDGVRDGVMEPDLSRVGNGLTLREGVIEEPRGHRRRLA